MMVAVLLFSCSFVQCLLVAPQRSLVMPRLRSIDDFGCFSVDAPTGRLYAHFQFRSSAVPQFRGSVVLGSWFSVRILTPDS
jgi:hypothetical protein